MRPDQRYPHTIEMVRALREAITPTGADGRVAAPISRSYAAGRPLPVVVRLAPASHRVRRIGGRRVRRHLVHADDRYQADRARRPDPGRRRDSFPATGWTSCSAAAATARFGRPRMPGKTHCALKIVRNLDAVQGKQEFKSLDMIRDLDHDRLIRLQAYWLLAYDGSVIPDEQIGQPGAPKSSGLVVATDLAQQNLLQRWQECYDQGQAGIPGHGTGAVRPPVGRGDRPPELPGAGDHSPRHQAGEHSAHQEPAGEGERLRAGQAGRGHERGDQLGVGRHDAGLRRPGDVPQHRDQLDRSVFAGRHLLPAAGRPAAVRGRARARSR